MSWDNITGPISGPVSLDGNGTLFANAFCDIPILDGNIAITFNHLADAFTQSHLQMRTMEAINKREICKCILCAI